MIRRQLGALLILLTSAACSSSGGDAPAEDSAVGDTSVAVDSMLDDVTVSADTKPGVDAALDTGRDSTAFDATSDRGTTDTTPPPGACNTLTPASPVVNYRRVAGPPPAALGGTVLDGDYVTAELVEYDTGVDSLSPSPATQRTVIAGSVVQEVIETDVGKPPEWSTYSLATSGTAFTFTLTRTCGAGLPPSPMTYTATATQLTLYYRAGGKNWAEVLGRAP